MEWTGDAMALVSEEGAERTVEQLLAPSIL